MSGSASARAAMQLRMSPTGGIPSSSRSAPDEPPSSATVTIAVRLLVCSFRPRSSVDRPVPPPMATILGSRRRAPVAAAEGDDARAAGEEPLLVDDVGDRRLLVHPQRLRQRLRQPP